MAISVYYPYYDVKTNIDTPKFYLPMLSDIKHGRTKVMINPMRGKSKSWLNIPDQDYIQPSNEGSD